MSDGFMKMARCPEGNASAPSHTPGGTDPDMQASADELIYDTGVMRMFGDCDIGTSGLVSGWSVPEEAHVWNDGPEVVMKIRMPTPHSACRLTFDGTPFLNASCKHQDVTLFANGFYVGFWRLTETKNYQLSVTLEPEKLLHRNGTSVVRLIWCIPQSVRPVDVGGGVDSRELGFCYRSFLVVEEA